MGEKKADSVVIDYTKGNNVNYSWIAIAFFLVMKSEKKGGEFKGPVIIIQTFLSGIDIFETRSLPSREKALIFFHNRSMCQFYN